MSLSRLAKRIDAVNSMLCIGLDPEQSLFAERADSVSGALLAFNIALIQATHMHTAAYKLNTAFYEAYGSQGWQQLEATIDYLRSNHPDVFIIADAKRGDIGHTSERYAAAFFDHLGVDAVTLNPLMGYDALAPFLARDDRTCIILCRTSNPSASDYQDKLIDGRPLWHYTAELVATQWNQNANCMMVVGATQPEHIAIARQLAPNVPFLIPGVGAQGGDLPTSVSHSRMTDGKGMLINIGRAIIQHSDPQRAAHRFQLAINDALTASDAL